jgi:hypothetical protein
VTRKTTLASLVAKAAPGILLNNHFRPTVFAHACRLGLEGIVSKRKGSPYRSGRTPDWIKVKNPASPAAKRLAFEFFADGQYAVASAETRLIGPVALSVPPAVTHALWRTS